MISIVNNGNSGKPLALEMCCSSRYHSTNQLDHDPNAETRQSDIESQDILRSTQNIRNDETNSAPALPDEMWLQIFCNLSHADLLEVNLVCKHWSQLARAPALTRKSKLVTARENLKDICDLVEHNEFKFQTVEIVDGFDSASDVEHALLLKMFKYLRSNIVQLKLNRPLTLAMLNNPLPKLKELDLSNMCLSESVSVDLSKFSKLKSLLLPYGGEHHINIQLSSPLTEMPKIRLEKLRIDMHNPNCLNLLTMNASSLRRLEINLGSATLKEQNHLHEIFKKFEQLKVLRIGGFVDMIDQSMRFLLENLPKENRLKAITVNWDAEPVELLDLIARRWFSCIKSLGLWLTVFDAERRNSENLAKRLGGMSGKLRRLRLDAREFTPQDLLHSIAPKINTKLTELELFKPDLTEELLLKLFQRLPNLTALDLSFSQLTDEEIHRSSATISLSNITDFMRETENIAGNVSKHDDHAIWKILHPVESKYAKYLVFIEGSVEHNVIFVFAGVIVRENRVLTTSFMVNLLQILNNVMSDDSKALLEERVVAGQPSLEVEVEKSQVVHFELPEYENDVGTNENCYNQDFLNEPRQAGSTGALPDEWYARFEEEDEAEEEFLRKNYRRLGSSCYKLQIPYLFIGTMVPTYILFWSCKHINLGFAFTRDREHRFVLFLS
uniref:F-box domain-containing protein n=1 Tax=Glossina austeni TaxID=7395 RepID=A0A1A9V198_GLOAU